MPSTGMVSRFIPSINASSYRSRKNEIKHKYLTVCAAFLTPTIALGITAFAVLGKVCMSGFWRCVNWVCDGGNMKPPRNSFRAWMRGYSISEWPLWAENDRMGRDREAAYNGHCNMPLTN